MNLLNRLSFSLLTALVITSSHASDANSTDTSNLPTPEEVETITQLQQSFPPCAIECIDQGAKDHGCSLYDIKCQCSKMSEMVKTVSPCFVKAGCDLEEITGTYSAILKICASIGIVPQDSQRLTDTVDDNDSKGPASEGTPTERLSWNVVMGLGLAIVMVVT